MAHIKTPQKYTGEFKQHVVETMLSERLSYKETLDRFELKSIYTLQSWEIIYLRSGPRALYLDPYAQGVSALRQRDKYSDIHPNIYFDLAVEYQKLKMENSHLKALYEMVLEEERQMYEKRLEAKKRKNK